MTITFNDGTTSYHPLNLIVDGYEPTTPIYNVEHEILNGPNAYTLRAAGLRGGRFRVLMADRPAALAFYGALRAVKTWTFADTDNSDLAMDFIPFDSARPILDDSTRRRWWVDFGWREVDV